MDIELEPAYGCPDETALLFSEYTSLLTEIDGSFQQYLELQNYSEELANPQKKIQSAGRKAVSCALRWKACRMHRPEEN